MILGQNERASEPAQARRFDRFDEWNAYMARHFPHRRRTADDPDRFRASVSRQVFESFGLFDIRSSAYVSETTDELFSQPAPERRYALVICMSGGYAVAQDGVRKSLLPGDMALFDSRKPGAIAGLGDSAHLLLSMPGQVWETHTPAPMLDGNYAMDGRRTTARLARSLVVGLAQANSDIGPRHRPIVVRQVAEFVGLALADAAEPSPETLHRQVLLRNIKAFIRSQISNPDLAPAVVADHFGVSVRYVSSLFSGEPETLMAHAKRIRIQRAAEMLRADKSGRMQIKDICHRVGFKTQAHFAHAFSAEFGVSPKGYRASILAGSRPGGRGGTPAR